MRVYVTGASGFVGSNLVHVLAKHHGAEIITPTHTEVDLTDPVAIERSVAECKPDAIVHAAIWNAFSGLLSDRRRAWDSFVGATHNVVDAANRTGAHVVLISTDWVFDGTQGPAREDEPPNPIHSYGFLKAASELVVSERAQHGAVARIAGVQGVHHAAVDTLRVQDAGFGYLVVSLVRRMRAGERFAVWDGPGLNTVATPVLATDAAEMIWRVLEREATGILHCCGGEHIDRVSLARRAVQVFGLDPRMLDVTPPPAAALGGGPVPYDTRLDARATASALGIELPDVDGMLNRLLPQLEAVCPVCAA